MDRDDSEDEAFVEEVCTFDFTDDDRDKKDNQIYHEYPGEDFAQYLADDDNIYLPPAPPAVQRRKKELDRHSRADIGQSEYHLGPIENEYLAPQEARTVRGNNNFVKDRVSKWLDTVKQKRGSQYQWDAVYTSSPMSNFSYADSKIGITVSGEGGGPESDSGIDTRSIKTHSDIGYQPKKTASPSIGGWSDTNASRYTQKRPSTGLWPPMLSARRRSKSTANLRQDTSRGRSDDRASMPTSRDPSTSSLSKGVVQEKLTNAFKKLSNTLSRGKKLSSNERQTAMSYNNEYEDIKL